MYLNIYQMYNTSKNYYSTAVYQMYSNIYQTYIKHISNTLVLLLVKAEIL